MHVAGLQVVGRDHYGVFPLRGKLRNVRELTVPVTEWGCWCWAFRYAIAGASFLLFTGQACRMQSGRSVEMLVFGGWRKCNLLLYVIIIE